MALMTIAEVIAAQPPNGPVTSSTYWSGKKDQAEQAVKDICRRKLESAEYTEYGNTVTVETARGTSYVIYLGEPTGSVLEYANITLTLNGSTVAETDCTILEDRIIVETSGYYVLTYTGGYSTVPAAIQQAVIHTMLILHEQQQNAGLSSRSTVGESVSVQQTVDALAPVKNTLRPYIRQLYRQPYNQHPDD